jgi:hypothetical protein
MLPLIGCSSSKTVVKAPAPRQPDYHVVVHEPSGSDDVLLDDLGDPPAQRRKHQFTYYQRANVYFDVEAKRYFWLEDGQWLIGERLPRRIVLEAGTAKSLSLDPDRPYDDNKLAKGSDEGKNQPNGKAVGHSKANAKAKGKGRQTASAVGDSP